MNIFGAYKYVYIFFQFIYVIIVDMNGVMGVGCERCRKYRYYVTKQDDYNNI